MTRHCGAVTIPSNMSSSFPVISPAVSSRPLQGVRSALALLSAGLAAGPLLDGDYWTAPATDTPHSRVGDSTGSTDRPATDPGDRSRPAWARRTTTNSSVSLGAGNGDIPQRWMWRWPPARFAIQEDVCELNRSSARYLVGDRQKHPRNMG